MKDVRTIKNLRLRYLVALSIIAFLVTASFLTMQQVISKQRYFSGIINMAGQQSGLVSRIAHFVSMMAVTDEELEFNMARSQVGRAIHKITQTHQTLRAGDVDNGISPLMNETLRIIYEDPMVGLDQALERFIEKAQAVYDSEMGRFDVNSAAYLFISTYGPHVLEPLLNAAVDEYEKINRQAIYRMERFERMVWIATLIAILFEILFIFKPLEKNVEQVLNSLSRSISNLENTKKRLLRAQKLAQVGDWEYEVKTGRLTWSKQVYQIFGLNPRSFAVTRQSCIDYVHPEDRESVGNILKLFKTDNENAVRMEYRIIRPDGRERLVDQYAVAKSGDDNRITIIQGTIQDITQRRELTTRLEKLSQLIPGFIFQLHRDKKGNVSIPFATSGMKEVTGLSPDQVYTDSQSFYTLFHDVDLEKVQQNVIESSRSLNTWRDQYRINHRLKGMVWLEGHATPERLGNGETLWYGYAWDITAKKEEEEEKAQLIDQLNQSNKMQAIGTLAGGIAHDFNNILAAMMGYANIGHYYLDDPEKMKNILDQIDKATLRASELVKQILAFSRRDEEQTMPMKLSLSLQEALKFLRSSIPAEIEIKKEINSRAYILADPTKVHQVIMNLGTNAYHAMQHTGGTLTLKLVETLFSKEDGLKLNIPHGKYLTLMVSDTGHGMDKETMGRVFEPYFTTKGVGDGTGLGLSVVDGIVKSQNGYVRVESQIGKGSTFSVFWPVHDASRPAKIQPLSDQKPVRGTETVMLVDDEADLIEVMREILERNGYKADCFPNGEAALAAFEKAPYQYDIIVTDMAMPKLPGDKLAVKLLKIRKNIPIIVCSGYHKNLENNFLEQMGIERFVQKPVKGQELLDIIRQVLDHKKEKRLESDHPIHPPTDLYARCN